MVQERVKLLAEVPGGGLALPRRAGGRPRVVGEGGMKVPAAAAILDAVVEAYAEGEWDADVLKETLRVLGEAFGLKLGKAQAPVRVAVTGRTVGPPLFESLKTLGRAAHWSGWTARGRPWLTESLPRSGPSWSWSACVYLGVTFFQVWRVASRPGPAGRRHRGVRRGPVRRRALPGAAGPPRPRLELYSRAWRR